MTNEFAAGFIAGEASFRVKHRFPNGNLQVLPDFNLSQSYPGVEVVYEIRDDFGNIGSISEKDTSNIDRTVNDMVSWSVQSKDDLQKLISEMEKVETEIWTITDKYNDYKRWRKAVDIYTSGRCGDEERRKMAEIGRELSTNSDANWERVFDHLDAQ